MGPHVFDGACEAAARHVVGFAGENRGNQILQFLRRVLLIGITERNSRRAPLYSSS